MLSTGLKQSLTLALIMAALAGCSSTSTTDQDASANDAMNTGTAQTGGTSSTDTMDEAQVLDTIFYFGFDQSTLTADARANLTAHAAQLKAAPRSVRLEGHTDERGTREYNMALGERRAKA
ncbi:OmpA family protein, partial [Pseudomaricurvus sp.]|uniref:OmpA family protein n=1 Tax=Pseudomaricurvus sp. TaxID=2004510 RepID=UPI003F6D5491